MKGTFSQGWWSCFESVAAELEYQGGSCMNILKEAGITAREAKSWIDRRGKDNPQLSEIVGLYWYSVNF